MPDKHKRCKHNRQWRVCRECGGNSFCEHGRQHSRCKECGGSEICDHKIRRDRCKECKVLGIGGSGICEHDAQFSQCKKCKELGVGGSGICEHGTQRCRCKKCGGSSICRHNRTQCKECEPEKFICVHGRWRTGCSTCKPKGAFRIYAYHAEKRGFEFSLRLDEFKSLVAQSCFYCGTHEEPRGIDRWDNSVGYTIGNSRPCCDVCNKAKRDLNGAAFVEHFQRMADYTRAVELSDLAALAEE